MYIANLYFIQPCCSILLIFLFFTGKLFYSRPFFVSLFDFKLLRQMNPSCKAILCAPDIHMGWRYYFGTMKLPSLYSSSLVLYLIFFRYLFILFYMWVFCQNVCVPSACQVPMETRTWHWIPWEWKLWIDVNHHMGAEIQTWVFHMSNKCS